MSNEELRAAALHVIEGVKENLPIDLGCAVKLARAWLAEHPADRHPLCVYQGENISVFKGEGGEYVVEQSAFWSVHPAGFMNQREYFDGPDASRANAEARAAQLAAGGDS